MAGKLFAVSEHRHNGGIRVKREYGSSTVTTFLVGVEGSPADTWERIDGYGRTPGDRKTYALNAYRARHQQGSYKRFGLASAIGLGGMATKRSGERRFPFVVLVVDDHGGKIVHSFHETRGEAERAASRASRADAFRGRSVWGAEVRDNRDPGRWITVYKGGWLNDAQKRNAYEPEDQRRARLEWSKRR